MKTPFYRVVARTTSSDLTSYINSINFSDSIDENDVLTIKMNGVSLSLLDETILGEGTILLFSYGFLQGASSGQRLARITNIDYSYGSIISLTIKALDLGIILRKGKKNFSWEDITIKELVETIAAKNGMKAIIDPKIGTVDELSNKIKFLPQVNEDDFSVMKKALMSEGTGDFIVFTKDDKIYIKNRGLGKSSKKTFVYNNGEGDIISFSPKSRDTSKSEFSAKTEVVGIDPFSGEEISVSSDDKNSAGDVKLGTKKIHYDVNGAELKEKVLGKGVQKEEVKAQIVAPVSNQKEASILAKEIKEDQSLNDLTATLVIEGDPNLYSDDIVTISNVAKKHAGNWYIVKSTHSISKSSYTTILELAKNAANRSNATDAQTLENVNNTVGSDSTNDKKEISSVVKYDVSGKEIK